MSMVLYLRRQFRFEREITGKEIDKAMLISQGKTWDGVPFPRITIEDLIEYLFIRACLLQNRFG